MAQSQPSSSATRNIIIPCQSCGVQLAVSLKLLLREEDDQDFRCDCRQIVCSTSATVPGKRKSCPPAFPTSLHPMTSTLFAAQTIFSEPDCMESVTTLSSRWATYRNSGSDEAECGLYDSWSLKASAPNTPHRTSFFDERDVPSPIPRGSTDDRYWLFAAEKLAEVGDKFIQSASIRSTAGSTARRRSATESLSSRSSNKSRPFDTSRSGRNSTRSLSISSGISITYYTQHINSSASTSSLQSSRASISRDLGQILPGVRVSGSNQDLRRTATARRRSQRLSQDGSIVLRPKLPVDGGSDRDDPPTSHPGSGSLDFLATEAGVDAVPSRVSWRNSGIDIAGRSNPLPQLNTSGIHVESRKTEKVPTPVEEEGDGWTSAKASIVGLEDRELNVVLSSEEPAFSVVAVSTSKQNSSRPTFKRILRPVMRFQARKNVDRVQGWVSTKFLKVKTKLVATLDGRHHKPPRNQPEPEEGSAQEYFGSLVDQIEARPSSTQPLSPFSVAAASPPPQIRTVWQTYPSENPEDAPRGELENFPSTAPEVRGFQNQMAQDLVASQSHSLALQIDIPIPSPRAEALLTSH